MLLERARHFLARVDLQDVPRLDPVDAVDADPALETGEHLTDLVLEALQGADGALAEDLFAPAHAHPGSAHDLALRDVRAADGAELRDDEDLTNLRPAERRLANLRREQPGEGGLEVVDRLVDDVVVSDVDAVRLRLGGRFGLGLHVEPQHDRVGRRREHHVAFSDHADRAVDDLQLHLVGRQPFERLRQRPDGTLDVGLQNEPQLLHLAGLDLLLQPLERDARRRLTLRLVTIESHGRDLPRLALVRDDHQHVAGGRHTRESLDLDGVGGPRGLDLLAGGVEQRAHAPGVGTDDDRIALLEGAVLDQRGGDRTAASVEPALDDDALRGPAGVGLELEDFRLERGHFEELIDPRAPLGRGGNEDGLAAPLFRDEVEVRQLAFHAIGVGLGLVDLVDRDDDRHVRRARVVEGLLARRVQEGHLPVRGRHLIGTDMLRDPAELLFGDLRLPDGVQERCLAVVDVAHHRDHRRAQRELTRIEVFLVDDVTFHRTDFDVDVELVGHELGGRGVEQLVERRHHTEIDERLDHFARFPAHLLGELADRDRLVHANELSSDLDRGRRLRLFDDDRSGDGRRCRRHGRGSGSRSRRKGSRPRGRGERGRPGRRHADARRREGTRRLARGAWPGRRRGTLDRTEGNNLRLGLLRAHRHHCRGRFYHLGRRLSDDGRLRHDLGLRERDERRFGDNLRRRHDGSGFHDRRRRLDLRGRLVLEFLLLCPRRLLRDRFSDRRRGVPRLPGLLRLRHALRLRRLGQLAPLAELYPQRIRQRAVNGTHGTNALVAHLLGRDHQILARHAEFLGELDDLYLCRCHSPLTSLTLSLPSHPSRQPRLLSRPHRWGPQPRDGLPLALPQPDRELGRTPS